MFLLKKDHYQTICTIEWIQYNVYNISDEAWKLHFNESN